LKDTNISDGSSGRKKWMFCAQGTALEATSKARETRAAWYLRETEVSIIVKR